MQHYNIYLFTLEYTEGDFTDTEIYATDFFKAWDAIIEINPGYVGSIEFKGIEYSSCPWEWTYLSTQIRLFN